MNECQCGEPSTVILIHIAGWVTEACLHCALAMVDPLHYNPRPAKEREPSDKEQYFRFEAQMMALTT